MTSDGQRVSAAADQSAPVLDDGDVRAVFAAALGTGADFAEIYAESRHARSVRLDDGRIEELTTGRDLGAGVRVVSGLQTGYAYTNVLTRDALVAAARTAAAGLQGTAAVRPADLRTHVPAVAHPAARDPRSADGADLADIARRTEDAARSHAATVRQVTVRWADTRQGIFLVNSEGLRVVEDRVRCRLVCLVVAVRDGVIQTGHEAPGAAVGLELLDANPPEVVGQRAAQRAVAMLDADPAPSGELTVVLAPGSGGVLFHEACGHGMEADIVAKGASVYGGRQGERIGTTLVTGVDDATVPGAWGSYGVDDEGTPAERTTLFAEGVCTDYLTDRLRARQLGIPPSGNARRQSYAHLPIPRMTNSYILPGDADPAEVVRQVGYGLYCDALGGGQVDPASGDFVFGVDEAHLIEGGELTRRVRGANLIGDGPTVLGQIDAVGSDFDTREGVCGKEGQGVPAGLGNPTLRIASMTVGGTG